MQNNTLLSTGITGLDEILKGGLRPERFYLVRGGPGTGKTTLGLHFLNEGVNNGETSLLVSMVEPIDKIIQDGHRFGLVMDGLKCVDLGPESEFISENQDYDIFPSSQMEQKPLLQKLTGAIKRLEPDRVFFDGVTQLKYLASDEFSFRKQILSLMQFVKDYNTTILLTSEVGVSGSDDDLQFLVDGIINLNYKHQLHTVEVNKYRGSSFRKGVHSLKFGERGIEIYPWLEVHGDRKQQGQQQVSSGIAGIDQLLHGGLERGTTTTITGPSGVGKTTLGTLFVKEGAGCDDRSIIYTFEEAEKTLLQRTSNINIPLERIKDNDRLMIKKVDPLEYTPEEFSFEVRQDVENRQASLVMLDSISGYFLSFKSPNDQQTMLRGLHTLTEYLKNRGVTVIMINEMKNITGDFRATDYGTSYLADNIIFLRYLEIKGRLNKAIGVLKKRMSGFENTMREFRITADGVKVGKPLQNLQGVLSGTPEIVSYNYNQEEV